MHYCFDATPSYCASGNDERAIAKDQYPLFVFLDWLIGRYYAPGGVFPGVLESIDPWNEPNSPGSFSGTYLDDSASDLVVHANRILRFLNFRCPDRLRDADKLFLLTPSFTDISGVEPMRNYLSHAGAKNADVFAFHAYGGDAKSGLYYDPMSAARYVSMARGQMPGATIWMTEVGDSNPTKDKVVATCASLKRLGIAKITLFDWDGASVGDMALRDKLSLAEWNELYAVLTR